MKHIICTDIRRDEGTPLYTVKVYDIDTPVNSHSYDCVFYKQGRDLDNLLQLANEKIEYARKDAFIEKLDKWLSLNLKMLMNVLDVEYNTHEIGVKDFIEDCKKYMKGE